MVSRDLVPMRERMPLGPHDRQAATDCGGWLAGHNRAAAIRLPKQCWTMNSRMKTVFYCDPFRWLNVEARGSPELPQEQAMRNPKPFTGLQPIPGQSPKPLFTIHSYSIEQARALVASKVAGETIVVAVTRDGAA